LMPFSFQTDTKREEDRFETVKDIGIVKRHGVQRMTRSALEKENIESRPIWPPARRAYASERNRCLSNPFSKSRKQQGQAFQNLFRV